MTEDITFNSLLNDLSEYGVGFELNSENVTILQSPDDFYNELIHQTQNAQNRILMSTLYIGQGTREKDLVSCIVTQIEKQHQQQPAANNSQTQITKTDTNKDQNCFEFNLLMDCSRATRNIDSNKSSLNVILPILELQNQYKKNINYDNNNSSNNKNIEIKIGLFRSPQLSFSYLARLFGYNRTKEIFGVHHIKAFIFDSNLIITGANLNETYLNNRQDRYYLIKNQSMLTNYIYTMLSRLNDCSSKVTLLSNDNKNGNEKEKEKEKEKNVKFEINHDIIIDKQRNKTINCQTNTKQWLEYVCKQLSMITQSTQQQSLKQAAAQSQSESQSQSKGYSGSDSYIFVSSQMQPHITSDFNITSYLFSLKIPLMNIATAYFNFDDKYKRIFYQKFSQKYNYNSNRNNNSDDKYNIAQYDSDSDRQRERVHILTSSAQCNSFYKAKGFSSYITHFYDYFAQSFVSKCSNSEYLKFSKYNRNGWTFHGKGIWFDCNHFGLTMIGSSNFNQRSVNLDSELSFTLLTKNTKLRQKISNEWKYLNQWNMQQNTAMKQSQNDDNRKQPSWFDSFLISWMAPIVTTYM